MLRPLFISLLLSSTAHCAAQYPSSMVAIGDSITSGALASTHGPKLSIDPPLWWIERKYLSWSSGHDPLLRVKSHLLRLEMASLHHVRSKNLAVSGYTARDLVEKTMPRLREWVSDKNDGYYPGYATLLIGANDICGQTTPQSFEKDVSQVVDELAANGTKTLIVSLPQIEALFDLAHDAIDIKMFRCEDVWKKLDVCPRLTTKLSASEKEQLDFMVLEYNEALKRIALRHQSTIFANIHDDPFTISDLAIDCFHPNAQGQQKIAEKTWQLGFWPSKTLN